MQAVMVFAPALSPSKDSTLPRSGNRADLRDWNQNHPQQPSRERLIRLLARYGLRLPSRRAFLALRKVMQADLPDGFYPLRDTTFQFGTLEGDLVYPDVILGPTEVQKPIAVVGISVDSPQTNSI